MGKLDGAIARTVASFTKIAEGDAPVSLVDDGFAPLTQSFTGVLHGELPNPASGRSQEGRQRAAPDSALHLA